MKYLVLIQARCGSTRLPNKVMADLSGKTDLQRVIERVKRSRHVDEVMVITSIEKNNLPLIKLCAELGTRVYVGAENDVLDRYYQAAKLIEPEYVVRITADCPLFDWRYLDDAIEKMENDSDYLWQADEDFPDGLDLEIIKYNALEKSWREARLCSEREHVTQYLRKHPELFKVQNYKCPIAGLENKRWTLDEEEDYEFIKIIYKYFIEQCQKEDFVTEDILKYISENPEIEKINSKYTRNEGLQKSLMNDGIF